MIEYLEVNGRERHRIVCDGCRVPAVSGVYPTERKALQALKSAGKSIPGRVSPGHWECDKCRKTFVEREREGKREGKRVLSLDGGGVMQRIGPQGEILG